MSSTFRYLDSDGTVHSQVFDVLTLRGDRPWKWRLVPEVILEKIDGSTETQFQGFRRIFSIELRALNAYEDFIRAFLQAETKSFTFLGINYVSEESHIVYESSAFEDEWYDGFKLTKRYVIELAEDTIRTVWPTPVAPIITDIMYIKKKVQITGTQASPESFTTNAGKLQYNYGTVVFPDISLLAYTVSVFCNSAPYQDAKVNQVGDITQSGSNISFQLAVSDTGNPSSDGNFYTDITIALQAIV